MRIYVVLMTFMVCLCPQIAAADNFMLPKSFSDDMKELQHVNIPTVNAVSKPVHNIVSPQAEPIRAASVSPPANTPQIRTVMPTLTTVPTTISLTELIRNYKYDYFRTLVSILVSLEELNLGQIYFDSSKGQIFVSPANGKDIFILLLPSQDNLTSVRITPADGQYNINREMVNSIFSRIDHNISGEAN